MPLTIKGVISCKKESAAFLETGKVILQMFAV